MTIQHEQIIDNKCPECGEIIRKDPDQGARLKSIGFRSMKRIITTRIDPDQSGRSTPGTEVSGPTGHK